MTTLLTPAPELTTTGDPTVGATGGESCPTLGLPARIALAALRVLVAWSPGPSYGRSWTSCSGSTVAGNHFGPGRAWRRTALVRRYRFLI